MDHTWLFWGAIIVGVVIAYIIYDWKQKGSP